MTGSYPSPAALTAPARSGFGLGALAAFLFALGVGCLWVLLPVAELPLLLAGALAGAVIAMRRPLIPCLVCLAVIGFRVQDAFPVLYPLRLPLLTSVWAAFALVAAALSGTADFRLPPAFRWMLAFVAATSAANLFALDAALAWDYFLDSYVKILIVILTFFFVVRSESQIGTISTWVVLFGVVIASAAIYNWTQGIDLVEGTRVTIGRRIGSPLGDPNDLALTLFVPLSFATAQVLYRGGRAAPLHLCGIAIILLAIVFTQSRGGILGVVTLFVAFGWRLVPSKALLLSGALLGGLALYVMMGISDRSVVSASSAGLDDSASARLTLWNIAIRTFLANPLLGIGMDNFPVIAAIHTGLAHATHNTWLQVAVETGVIGLVAFTGMVVTTIRSAYRTESVWTGRGEYHPAQAAGAACFAAALAFCVSSSFITHAFTWTIYFIVCLAALAGRTTSDAA